MALHHVDPLAEHSKLYRALERFGRSRAGEVFARNVLFPIDPWLYRLTSGRYPRIMGGTVAAPLVSVGAKSGRPREHQLAYFHDGPDVVLIASNFGGATHPHWYYNLKANPECRFGGDEFVATEVTDPDQHARLFALAEKVFAGYGDYRIKTASIGRRIPVFRLTPR